MIFDSKELLEALEQLPTLELVDGDITAAWRERFGEVLKVATIAGDDSTVTLWSGRVGGIATRAAGISGKAPDKQDKHQQRLNEAIAGFNQEVANFRGMIKSNLRLVELESTH